MHCFTCNAFNSSLARFCNQCGGQLGIVCPRCRYVNEKSAQYCGGCSELLAARDLPAGPQSTASAASSEFNSFFVTPEHQGERKIVTALFADIKGSVELIANLDPEVAQSIVEPAIRLMGEAVRMYGGYVVHTTGDGIFALFGAPVAHQEHPQFAIHAALELQKSLRKHSDELINKSQPSIQCRVGVNTGEVVVRAIETGGTREFVPIGHPVNLASRLQATAPPDTILIGATTAQLVDGYFRLQSIDPLFLKGIPDPITAYLVNGIGALQHRIQQSMKRGLSKFVGREREIGQLKLALESADRCQGQIIEIITEAGAGKSRLVYEFGSTLTEHYTVLEAFSLSHGKSQPWLPVISMLQGYFSIRPQDSPATTRDKIRTKLLGLDASLVDDVTYLYGVLGVQPDDESKAQMSPLVRRMRFLELVRRILIAESQQQTIVVVFEDLHWMDRQSRLLLNVIADSIATSRVLLLVTSRPGHDFGWGERDNYLQIRLDLLTQQGAEEMLSSLLPASDELQELKKLIIAKTGGHPFFIEEIIQALFEDGTLLYGTPVRLTRPLVELQLPPTVQVTLAERIDSLESKQKKTLQILSVMGDRSPLELIREVCCGQVESVAETLAALHTHGYIQPTLDQGIVTYEFNHALVQEVAYRSMLSSRRQSLHELVASSMEHLYAERLDACVGQLAYHFCQAANTPKANEYLSKAGEDAIQRSAHQEAEDYLRRAIRLLEESPVNHDRLLRESRLWLALGVCLLTSKGYADQDVGAAFEKARQLGEQCGDTLQLVSAVRGHSIFCIVRADYENSFRLGKLLEALDGGDWEYAVEYQVILGHYGFYTGQLRLGQQHFLQAVTPARKDLSLDIIQYSGHSRAMSFSYLALNTWYLGFPDQALEQSHSAFELAQQLSIPITLCQAQGMLGILGLTMRLNDMAEEWIDKTCAYADEHGFPYWLILGSLLKAWLVTVRTCTREGIHRFEQCLHAYIDSGARIGLPWFYTLLAELHIQCDQAAEGLLATEEALRWIHLTGERYHEAEVLRIQGQLFLLAGTDADDRLGSALHLFRQSLAVARQQEAKSMELRAAMSIADLLSRCARPGEALEVLQPVHEWFTDGFATPDLEDACRLLGHLQQAAVLPS